jgi:cytochrome c oxidase subunit III
MSDHSVRVVEVEMQYGNAAHQASTAVDGTWLFLATELLFFGGLFLVWTVYRIWHPVGYAEATAHTNLVIGSINTALLLCSSLTFTLALGFTRHGDNRMLGRLALLTALLGVAFLVLKGFEWREDFAEHLFPGPGFAISGPNSGPAEIFYSFYFVATGLHGMHMVVGIFLVGWIAMRASRGAFSPVWYTPVEVVGLYWSFVDLIWLILYPLIYLQGRP